MEVNRFTRVVFGLTQSPFMLESALKKSFNNYRFVYPEHLENIRKDMYLDDLVLEGNILIQVEVIKQKPIELFAKDDFY